DEVLLQHVLLNLLDNALKYSPDKSAIQISARQVSQNVELEVRDHGTGFDQGEESLIFQKFKRGSAAKSKTGVGLGLAICKAIIEAHGGEITARNNPDGGASFIISLPAQEPIQLPQEESEA
ncbi:MAG: ATP-binding protein, partial [Candidatus Sumerlaeia bacterium]|nr:ATP-binding protein [Candidatus Sumerlaeia bacterium]